VDDLKSGRQQLAGGWLGEWVVRLARFWWFGAGLKHTRAAALRAKPQMHLLYFGFAIALCLNLLQIRGAAAASICRVLDSDCGCVLAAGPWAEIEILSAC